MKNRAAIFLAMMTLVLVGLACGLFNQVMSLTNLRMAFDQDGNAPTTVFSSNDEFFAVGDLDNAPAGTLVTADWRAVAIDGYAPEELIFHQEINDFTDDLFTGSIYFQLSNDQGWQSGEYKVDVLLNDNLVETLYFNVR